MIKSIHLGGFQFNLDFPSDLTFYMEGDQVYSKFLEPAENSFPPTHQVFIEAVAGALEEKWLEVLRSSPPLMDNGVNWAMYETHDPTSEWKYIIRPPEHKTPRTQEPEIFYALASADFSRIRIYLDLADGQIEVNAGKLNPLDNILLRHLVEQHQGMIVHASGVRIGDKGYLFLGDSGAGKSTIAQIFEEALGEGRVLSDDRILIRRHRGKWWMFGTPWHGTFPRLLNEGLELGGLSFLEQTPRNEINILSGSERLTRFLKIFVAVWWKKDSAQRQLETLSQLIGDPTLHFFRLGFKPDSSIVNYFINSLRELSPSGKRDSVLIL